MSDGNLVAMMWVGGGFVLLGLIGIFWNRREEKGYYDSLVGRPDTREFLDKWPPRAQFGALKAGGWISLAIGLVLAIVGFAFWLAR